MILLMKKRKPIQMKTKQEICVPIRNEKELKQAREILERNGEKIHLATFKLTGEDYNFLYFFSLVKDWGLGNPIRKTEIPLSELEAVLRGESIKPHSFCETPEEKCTMNYCDDNDCQNRKRILVSDEPVLRGESESKKQSSIEWNSVKEVGMPKHSNTVLVVNNDYEDTLITLGIGINETEFYIIELKENSSNVTHWMELPEKPNKND